MSLRRYWTPRATVALSGLALSLGLAARAAHRALVLTPLPRPRPQAPTSSPLGELAPADPTPPRLIEAAVEHDVFRRERQPAPERFTLPGEAKTPGPASPSTPAALALLGTAVTGEGKGFAMCQRAGEAAKLVRVGERWGDLTLREVAQGRAVFRGKDGSTTELRVTKAGS